MKYDYTVKVNGKWYPPNTEIPENKKSKKETEKTEDKTEETDKK